MAFIPLHNWKEKPFTVHLHHMIRPRTCVPVKLLSTQHLWHRWNRWQKHSLQVQKWGCGWMSIQKAFYSPPWFWDHLQWLSKNQSSESKPLSPQHATEDITEGSKAGVAMGIRATPSSQSTGRTNRCVTFIRIPSLWPVLFNLCPPHFITRFELCPEEYRLASSPVHRRKKGLKSSVCPLNTGKQNGSWKD